MVERPDRYKVISRLIDDFIPSYGDWFETETIWRHITDQHIILSADGKRDVRQKLASEVSKGTLRRRGKKYKAIDLSTIKKVNPFEVAKESYIKVNWPNGFPFSGILVSEGDCIVLAGESNQGKSTFAQCFLSENWDSLPCFYISTETTPSKFVRRLYDIPNAEPLKDGEPKFQFATMDGDNYDEIIEPDLINIVDWVSLRGNYYEIENVIRDIKARLNRGIAVVVLQKKEGQDAPVGGEFAWRRADVCLLIQSGIVKVKKAKDFTPPNPNGKLFSFTIPDGVCGFANVTEVVKCVACRGNNKHCTVCGGSGYEDVYNYSSKEPTTTFANSYSGVK